MGDVAFIDWSELEGVTLAFLIEQIFNGLRYRKSEVQKQLK